MKEMFELITAAGFKKIEIDATHTGTRFENPDTYFFSIGNLNNFLTALKFLENERGEFLKGLGCEFSECKKRFKGIRSETYQKLHYEDIKFRQVREKEASNTKELVDKESESAILENEVLRLNDELDKHHGRIIPKEDIEKEALRLIVMDIVFSGIENSVAVGIARIKEFEDKQNFLPDDYKENFENLIAPHWRDIHKKFPKLEKESLRKLRTDWLEIGEKFGKLYLAKEKEGERYDFNKMHR